MYGNITINNAKQLKYNKNIKNKRKINKDISNRLIEVEARRFCEGHSYMT
jgi:hypothetical protein